MGATKRQWEAEQIRHPFFDKVFGFMAFPWQEEAETEFVSLITRYNKFLTESTEYASRSFLRRLAEVNEIWNDQRFTDSFLEEFEELICLK